MRLIVALAVLAFGTSPCFSTEKQLQLKSMDSQLRGRCLQALRFFPLSEHSKNLAQIQTMEALLSELEERGMYTVSEPGVLENMVASVRSFLPSLTPRQEWQVLRLRVLDNWLRHAYHVEATSKEKFSIIARILTELSKVDVVMFRHLTEEDPILRWAETFVTDSSVPISTALEVVGRTTSARIVVFQNGEFVSQIIELMQRDALILNMKVWGVSTVRLVLQDEKVDLTSVKAEDGIYRLYATRSAHYENPIPRITDQEHNLVDILEKPYLKFLPAKLKALTGVEWRTVAPWSEDSLLYWLVTNLGYSPNPAAIDDIFWTASMANSPGDPASAKKAIAALKLLQKKGLVLIPHSTFVRLPLGTDGPDRSQFEEHLKGNILAPVMPREIWSNLTRSFELSSYPVGGPQGNIPYEISEAFKYLESKGYVYRVEFSEGWVFPN